MEGKKASKQEILESVRREFRQQVANDLCSQPSQKKLSISGHEATGSTKSPERCQNSSSSVTSSSHLGRERSSKFLICAIHRSSQSSTSCTSCIAVQFLVPALFSMNVPKGLHPAGKAARVNTPVPNPSSA